MTVRKVIAQVYEATLNINLARLLVEKKMLFQDRSSLKLPKNLSEAAFFHLFI